MMVCFQWNLPGFCRAASLLLLLGAGSCFGQQAASGPGQQTAPAAPATSDPIAVVPGSNPGDVHLARTKEDFTSIALKGSDLEMREPISVPYANQPTFTGERVQVQWRLYDPIDLYVIKPKGVKNPPVIIYLYGYPAGPDSFKNEGWCQRVTSGGYAAVGFVGALTADRFRVRPLKQTYLTELPESIATTVHDVQMVMNYLEMRKDLDMSRVGVLGMGSGATIGILAAAADPRIKALDLMDPWGDWPEWLATSIELELPPTGRGYYLNPEFLAKLAPLDPVKWLPTLTTQRIHLQFIDADDVRTKKARDAMEAAAPKDTYVKHYEDRAVHMGATSGGRRFDWLKSQLRPEDDGKPPATSAAQISK